MYTQVEPNELSRNKLVNSCPWNPLPHPPDTTPSRAHHIHSSKLWLPGNCLQFTVHMYLPSPQLYSGITKTPSPPLQLTLQHTHKSSNKHTSIITREELYYFKETAKLPIMGMRYLWVIVSQSLMGEPPPPQGWGTLYNHRYRKHWIHVAKQCLTFIYWRDTPLYRGNTF